MEEQKILGQRIKAFRKRAGLSQMELETELDASLGSLSRIENGEVNPTKETLKKFVSVLNLNSREVSFLFNEYPSEIEKEDLIEPFKEVDYLLSSEKSFSYIADERFRLWKVSKGFEKLWNLKQYDLDTKVGMNLMEFMFTPGLPVYNLLRTDAFEETAKIMLARYRLEVPYWNLDDYSKALIARLMENPEFKKLWKYLDSQNLTEYIHNYDSRKVTFKIKGLIIESNYGREFLKSNPRFILVSYIPNKNMWNILKNNIKSKLWNNKS